VEGGGGGGGPIFALGASCPLLPLLRQHQRIGGAPAAAVSVAAAPAAADGTPRAFLLAASLPPGRKEVSLTLFTAYLGGEGRLSLAAPSDALPASLAASLQVHPSPAAAELASRCDRLRLLGGGGGPLLVVSSASLASTRFSAPSAPSAAAASSSSSSSLSMGLGGGGAWLLRDATGAPALARVSGGGGGGSVASSLLPAGADALTLGGGGGPATGAVVGLGSHVLRFSTSATSAPPARRHSQADIARLVAEAVSTFSAAEAASAAAPPSAAPPSAAAEAAVDPSLLSAPPALVAASFAALARRLATSDGFGGVGEAAQAAGGAAAAQSETSLERRADGTASLIRLVGAGGLARRLCDAAPAEVGKAREAAEKAAAAAALRRVQNCAASQEEEGGFVAILASAVDRLTGSSPQSNPQEAFYGPLPDGLRFEALLSAAASDAQRAAAEGLAAVPLASRMRRAAAVASQPILAAAEARRRHGASLATASGGGGDASEPVWTGCPAVTAPLLELAGSVAGAAARLRSAGDEAEAASLFAPLASLHAARLHCLLAPLAAHAATSPLPRYAAAEGAAEEAAPQPLYAFREARTDASKQLLGLGAAEHAASVAEAFHDFRTLARISASTPPPLQLSTPAFAAFASGGAAAAPPLLPARSATAPTSAAAAAAAQAQLRRRLLQQYVPEGRGAPPVAPPLYAGEYESEAGFGAELLQAYVEQGPNGCAAIFRASVASDYCSGRERVGKGAPSHPLHL